jgi:hypothetical protein
MLTATSRNTDSVKSFISKQSEVAQMDKLVYNKDVENCIHCLRDGFRGLEQAASAPRSNVVRRSGNVTPANPSQMRMRNRTKLRFLFYPPRFACE